MPCCSRSRSRSASVRGLIPWHECSSSEKRRGPSERSWTSSAVHFAPMISAHAATEQVPSWIAFIVRTETNPTARSWASFLDGLELVADAVARLDERVLRGVAVDLVSQPPHEDVDRAVAMGLPAASDLLQQLVAGRHSAAVERQGIEELELGRRQ